MPLYEGETLKEAIQKAVRGAKGFGDNNSGQASPGSGFRDLRLCDGLKEELGRLTCIERLSHERVNLQTRRLENNKDQFVRTYRWIYDRVQRPQILDNSSVLFPNPDDFDASADAIRDCQTALNAIYDGLRIGTGRDETQAPIPVGVLSVPLREQLPLRSKVDLAKQHLRALSGLRRELEHFENQLQDATRSREQFERANNIDACIPDRALFDADLRCE